MTARETRIGVLLVWSKLSHFLKQLLLLLRVPAGSPAGGLAPLGGASRKKSANTVMDCQKTVATTQRRGFVVLPTV